MEISARISAATALHGVHANSDAAVFVCCHAIKRMREAALALRPFAGTPLVLAAHLRTLYGQTKQKEQPETFV